MAQVPAKQAAEEAMVRTEAARATGEGMTIEQFAQALRRLGFDVVAAGEQNILEFEQMERAGYTSGDILTFRARGVKAKKANAVAVRWQDEEGKDAYTLIPWPVPQGVLDILDEHCPWWREEACDAEEARPR